VSDLYRTCSGRLYKGIVSVDKKICQFLLLANLNGIAQTKYENKVKEKFEDAKWVTRSHKSQQNRQYNGQKEDRQYNGQKKDRQYKGKGQGDKQRSTKHIILREQHEPYQKPRGE
jgi:hypothetical protein